MTMRTIKFRGFNRKNGVWLCGFYLQNRGAHFVCPDEFAKGKFWEDYEVDPDTVGQFTGLLDMNGKEIYEGDIIRLHDVGIFYVICNEERCQFELHGSGGFADKLWKLYTYRYEVIGNIYDTRK